LLNWWWQKMGNELQKEKVYQANKLIEAFYQDSFTAMELKLLRYAAMLIRNNEENFPIVHISLADLRDILDDKSNRFNSRVKQMCSSLIKKTVAIKISEERLRYMTWMSVMDYDYGDVTIQFNPEIKPYLLQLESNFTGYAFQKIAKMKSPHTIRLFELLLQYAKIKKRVIDVDNLKFMLGVGSKYEQYAHFKSRVLTPAQKELDELGGLTFTFKEIKEKRRVVSIDFNINASKELLGTSKRKLDPVFISEAKEILKMYGFTSLSDNEIITFQEYGLDLLKASLKEIKNKNITYPAAYILKILKTKQENKIVYEDHFKDVDESTQKLIYNFIESIRQDLKGNIPESIIEQSFDDYMKENSNELNKFIIWKNYKDKILKLSGQAH